MKIRVKLPEEIVRHKHLVLEFVDDILLWGMETEMDVDFYSLYPPDLQWGDKTQWAVFTVDNDYSYMFSLKYGATLHKSKEKNREI